MMETDAVDARSLGSSEDDLPDYGMYAMVHENYTNMTLIIQSPNNIPLQLQVANIDSVVAVKRRLCRILDNMQQVDTIELRFQNSNIKLENSESLAQLGITDGTELVLELSEHDITTPQDGKNGKVVIRENDDKSDGHEDSDDEQPPPEYSMIDHVLNGFGADNSELSTRQYCCCMSLYVLLALVFVVICVVLPISLIAIGASNLNRCPARSSIPVWMIVFGTIIILQTVMERVAARIRKRIGLELRTLPDFEVMPAARMRQSVEFEFSKRYRRMDQIDQLLKTCMFIWFVIGSVWVFGCSQCKDAFDPVLQMGCDSVTFHSSLVIIIILYVLLAMPFIAIMVYIVAMTFCRRSPTSPAVEY